MLIANKSVLIVEERTENIMRETAFTNCQDTYGMEHDFMETSISMRESDLFLLSAIVRIGIAEDSKIPFEFRNP